jgi:hypothetical protein
VRFFDRQTRQISELFFEPGTALIHHGSVPHESMPITEDERSNIVLWLYGGDGQFPPLSTEPKALSAAERWSQPTVASDGYAPF